MFQKFHNVKLNEQLQQCVKIINAANIKKKNKLTDIKEMLIPVWFCCGYFF